ncbi:MAG: ATP-dependent DNA helicase, partial [Bacteroidaceae bacterium]
RAIDNTSRMFRTSVSQQQQRPFLHNESKRDESPMHSTKNLRRVRTIPPSLNPAITGDQPLLIKGQSIEHERFGLGEVISVEGVGDNAKAKIKFQHAGEKQLLLRFARFKVLD